MNTKKMLAILAALSMLGTTGLTVGAEDTAATEPAVETVVTTEAEAETNPKSVIIRRTIQNLPGNLSGIWPCKSW